MPTNYERQVNKIAIQNSQFSGKPQNFWGFIRFKNKNKGQDAVFKESGISQIGIGIILCLLAELNRL